MSTRRAEFQIGQVVVIKKARVLAYRYVQVVCMDGGASEPWYQIDAYNEQEGTNGTWLESELRPLTRRERGGV